MKPEQYMYFLMILRYLIFLCAKNYLPFRRQDQKSILPTVKLILSPPGGLIYFKSIWGGGGLNRDRLNRDMGLI